MNINTVQPEILYSKSSFTSFRQFKPGTPVIGIATNFDPVTGSVIVDLEDFTGIIPMKEVSIEQFKLNTFTGIPCQIHAILGKKIRAIVTHVSEYTGHIMLSRKQSMLEAWETLQEGMIVDASVVKANKYGLFVDIGNGIISNITKSNCSATMYYDLSKWFKIGEITKVKISSKEPASYRILSSRKDAFPTLAETKDSISKNVVLTVRVGKTFDLEDGYFCEYTPGIAGIVDTTEVLSEGTFINAIVKRVSKRGIKLDYIP